MLISDIEANGLLDKEDLTFHCGVIEDFFTGEYTSYRPGDFKAYIKALEAEAAKPDGLIVFHNGIKYDHAALDIMKRKVLGKRLNIPRGKILDTLVCSRLMFNVNVTDGALLRTGKLPGNMFGRHSLESWGYRLGEMKGEYKTDFIKNCEDNGIVYTAGDEWLEFNESMMDYCVQDVKVTSAFTRKILGDVHYFPEGRGIEAIKLEHEAAWTLAKMERNGFPFDTESAEKLYIELAGRRSDLLQELIATFGSWYKPHGGKSFFKHPVSGVEITKRPKVTYPKSGGIWVGTGKNRRQDKRDFCEGAPFTPVIQETFMPTSRPHLIRVLKIAGWEPTEFTDKGSPVVDDETLEGVRVADPVAQGCIELVREYLMVQKRIGQLAEGDKAWLKYVKADGMIHGNINPNGAVTGRATHSFPNMGQVPSAKKPYGPACRALFGAKFARHMRGWENAVQAGSDASGLELRCLGHFGARYDEGAYAEQILHGDVHWANGLAAGLVPDGTVRDKHSALHESWRDNAKTFIYAFLYGAGDAKIGTIVGGSKKEGKALKKSFLENTPVISSLRESIEGALIHSQSFNQATRKFDIKWKRRWIKGLDGRKIHVRSPHSALNSLLQSAGALVCKAWVVECERVMVEELGYYHGWYKDDGTVGDFCFMAWVHDELQVACVNTKVAEDFLAASKKAIITIGERFNFRCPLDTDGKIGDTWKECH